MRNYVDIEKDMSAIDAFYTPSRRYGFLKRHFTDQMASERGWNPLPPNRYPDLPSYYSWRKNTSHREIHRGYTLNRKNSLSPPCSPVQSMFLVSSETWHRCPPMESSRFWELKMMKDSSGAMMASQSFFWLFIARPRFSAGRYRHSHFWTHKYRTLPVPQVDRKKK